MLKGSAHSWIAWHVLPADGHGTEVPEDSRDAGLTLFLVFLYTYRMPLFSSTVGDEARRSTRKAHFLNPRKLNSPDEAEARC